MIDFRGEKRNDFPPGERDYKNYVLTHATTLHKITRVTWRSRKICSLWFS